MDLKKLMGLRPANESTASIKEAQARAEAANAEAVERAEAARLHRDLMLLEGSAPQATAAQTALTEAREDVERTASIMTSLGQKLTAATRTETIAEAESRRAAYEKADSEMAAWWKKSATKIRDLLAEGYRMEDAARTAGAAYHRAKDRLAEDYPDVEFKKASTDKETDAYDWRDRLALWSSKKDLGGPVLTMRRNQPALEPSDDVQPVQAWQASGGLHVQYHDAGRRD